MRWPGHGGARVGMMGPAVFLHILKLVIIGSISTSLVLQMTVGC